MSEEKKNLGASSSDDTSALFVTARKKQIAEQEAQRKAAEEEAKRVAAEAEVRRLEAEVAARKQKAEEEARRIAQEAEERRRKAEEDARLEEERIAREAEERRRAAEAAARAEAANPPAPAPAPAGEKFNPLKKAATAVKPPMPRPAPRPAAPAEGAPKPPKPPKPAKPAAPAEGVATAKKPPMGLIIGGVVAVIAVIAVVLVFVLGGSSDDESGYLGWVEPLTISVDDYNEMGNGDRKDMVKTMNAIAEEEMGYVEPFAQEDVDDYLMGYSDPEEGSAFVYACDMMGIDGIDLVEGDVSMYTGYIDSMSLSINDFTGSYFALKVGMARMASELMAATGYQDTELNPVALAANVYDYIQDLPDEVDYDAPGGFVVAVMDMLGMDGEAAYIKIAQVVLDVADDMENDNFDPEEDADFYDYDTDLYFDVYDLMPDAHVGENLVDDANEIGYVTGSTGSCLIVFDMTDDYAQYSNTDEEMVQAMLEISIENFVPMLYGEVESYEYAGSTGESGVNNDILADAGYHVTVDGQTLSVFGHLRQPDHGDLIVLNLVMAYQGDQALSTLVNMTETQHIYVE